MGVRVSFVYFVLCRLPAAGKGVERVDGAVPPHGDAGSRHHFPELPPVRQDDRHGQQSLRLPVGLQREHLRSQAVHTGGVALKRDAPRGSLLLYVL